MSLEQAVLANTAAIEKLTALLAHATPPVVADEPVTSNGDKPSGKKVSGAAPKSDQPKQNVADVAAKAEEQKKLTYQDVRKPFLDLVSSGDEGKKAAIALLDKFGVDNLQKVAEKDWPKVLAGIEEARA